MLGPATIHADPLGLLVAFGAGMLSFLSPCVLPLVPAYLSMVSGLTAAELSALGSNPAASGEPAPAVLPVVHPVSVGAVGLKPEDAAAFSPSAAGVAGSPVGPGPAE